MLARHLRMRGFGDITLHGDSQKSMIRPPSAWPAQPFHHFGHLGKISSSSAKSSLKGGPDNIFRRNAR